MTESLYLGIDGGGTKTVAMVATESLRVIDRAKFGSGNLRLLSDESLTELFGNIAACCPAPRAIGIGLAGLRNAADEKRVAAAVRAIWGGVPFVATHDLKAALEATTIPEKVRARVLVLSGTGACCYGENEAGRAAKVGGWGHLLGDLGSGYDIGLSALKKITYEFDRHQRWGELGRAILRGQLLNEPEELISWTQSAAKPEIASLAPIVFEAAAKRDPIARAIVAQIAEQLASDAVNCAERLVKRSACVAFVLAGGILRNHDRFARRVAGLIRRRWADCVMAVANEDAAIGALKLALTASGALRMPHGTPRTAGPKPAPLRKDEAYVPRFAPEKSPTEMRNPKSAKLDRESIRKTVSVLLASESEVIPALRREQRAIERAVRFAADSLKNGGRIFYVGAGTSGRLGVLDASECPPTFRTDPEMVQGIMAGGQKALWQAVEGAEDNWEGGAASIRFRGVTRKDTVIGIAASGRTPFVWGALVEAKRTGGRTVLLCFNPSIGIDRKHRPDLVIAPNLGPEVLTGSTRLKCGTATKLILNAISTIAMVQIGKVVSNLMVDLNPSNIKLRDRAVRIVCELICCSPDDARVALERNGWVVKDALRSLGWRG